MNYYEVKLWFHVEPDPEYSSWCSLNNGIEFYECIVKSELNLVGDDCIYLKKYFETNGVEDYFTAEQLKTMDWGFEDISPLEDDIVFYDLEKINKEIKK